MSSFFIYKSLQARETELQYAFFIPGGAFQENTTVTEINLKPRYPKEAPSTQQEDDSSKNKNTPKENNIRKKISLPVEVPVLGKRIIKKEDFNNKKAKPLNKPVRKKETPPPTPVVVIKESSPQIIQTSTSSNKYELEENIPVLTAEHIIIEDDAKEEAPISPTLSPLEELLQADVEDLLKTIERPDSTQPLFKQLYGLYGIELRSLYRHKELPPNLSLEDTLQKANSMLRFEVK